MGDGLEDPLTRSIPLLLGLVAAISGCNSVPPLRMASNAAPGDTAGLTLRWFGASTVTISDGHSTIMVDAFLSRTGKARSALAFAGLPVIAPSDAALDRLPASGVLGPVDAIFVSHSHHDHVLDVARVARKTGAVVYGSASTKRVVNADINGLPFRVIGGGMSRCVGRFNVRVISSPHKPTFVGPVGEVNPSFAMPSSLRRFRTGESFAFAVEHPLGTLLVIPSAVISKGELPKKPPDFPPADVVLLGVGLMGRDTPEGMKNYWHAAISSRTSRVHPIHWDDFTRPLSWKLRPLPFTKMDHVVKAISGFAGDNVELSYLPVMETVTLPAFLHSEQNIACGR